MKILVGSKNPVKIEAVKEALENYFENILVEGIDVSSNVVDQPLNDDTFIGAQNRAMKLKEINESENLNADFFIGVEGGISKIFNKWFAYGCMCIINNEGNVGFGTSPLFELPDSIMKEILKGRELGFIIDEILNDENTKRKGGAISFFTNGVMNRKELYIEGLKTATIPFLHKEMFFKKS